MPEFSSGPSITYARSPPGPTRSQGRTIISGPDGLPRLSEVAPRGLEEARAALLQQVAAARWEREVAGMVVGEKQVGMSASDQSRLT